MAIWGNVVEGELKLLVLSLYSGLCDVFMDAIADPLG